jgi:hypothetical protein
MQSLATLPASVAPLLAARIRSADEVAWHDPMLVTAVQRLMGRWGTEPFMRDMYSFARSLVWPRPLFAIDDDVLGRAPRRCPRGQRPRLEWIDGFQSPQDLVDQASAMPGRFPLYCLTRGASRFKPHIVDTSDLDPALASRGTDTCHICCDDTDHLVLPCSHAMCMKCARTIAESQSPCPFCKRPFRLSKCVRVVL